MQKCSPSRKNFLWTYFNWFLPKINYSFEINGKKFWTVEIKTDFQLNLWVECSNNILIGKRVLLTSWGNTLNIEIIEIIEIILVHHNTSTSYYAVVNILHITSHLFHVWYNRLFIDFIERWSKPCHCKRMSSLKQTNA